MFPQIFFSDYFYTGSSLVNQNYFGHRSLLFTELGALPRTKHRICTQSFAHSIENFKYSRSSLSGHSRKRTISYADSSTYGRLDETVWTLAHTNSVFTHSRTAASSSCGHFFCFPRMSVRPSLCLPNWSKSSLWRLIVVVKWVGDVFEYKKSRVIFPTYWWCFER